jgi:hypothetical protein
MPIFEEVDGRTWTVALHYGCSERTPRLLNHLSHCIVIPNKSLSYGLFCLSQWCIIPACSHQMDGPQKFIVNNPSASRVRVDHPCPYIVHLLMLYHETNHSKNHVGGSIKRCKCSGMNFSPIARYTLVLDDRQITQSKTCFDCGRRFYAALNQA